MVVPFLLIWGRRFINCLQSLKKFSCECFFEYSKREELKKYLIVYIKKNLVNEEKGQIQTQHSFLCRGKALNNPWEHGISKEGIHQKLIYLLILKHENIINILKEISNIIHQSLYLIISFPSCLNIHNLLIQSYP